MPASSSLPSLYIGLMSGTSLDGVDGVLAAIPDDFSHGPLQTLASAFIPFPDELRRELMALQAPGANEIEREAAAANTLARHYADCVAQLRRQAGDRPVRAIGVHGQTIRHRPELGFTRQTNNPALLAELTGIDVIADLRSRDIAAGGQGAPLVPAFHQAVLGGATRSRVVLNIGGIANISVLPGQDSDGQVTGFDTGPGNVFLDYWIGLHQNQAYDAGGAWGRSGKVDQSLLAALRDEAFFKLAPPKSTGRDLLHPDWLADKLQGFAHLVPADVQATLCALTATTVADAVAAYAPRADTIYVCGGGAYNGLLLELLENKLRAHGLATRVALTGELGVAPNHVEALAFAWLAQRFCLRQPGNLPSVTGAKGVRILGALYPGS